MFGPKPAHAPAHHQRILVEPMSLTSHLDDPKSPVRRYLEWTTPLLSDASGTSAEARVAKKLLGIDKLPGLVTPNEAGANPGTVGAAYDYWVRYHLAVPDWRKLVAFIGASVVAKGVLPGSAPAIAAFFMNLNRLATRLDLTRPIPEAEEILLARYCVVLALFESVYRSGQLLWDLPTIGTGTSEPEPETEPMLQAARTAEVTAVLNLGRATQDTVATWRHNLAEGLSYTPNPTFDGSLHVGGADADIVLGDQIIEFKAVKELTPAAVRKALLQLVGYVMLDWGDSNHIRRVGVFFARHNYLDTWPLSALIRPPGDRQLAWMAEGDEPDEATVLARLQTLRGGMKRLVSGEAVDVAEL